MTTSYRARVLLEGADHLVALAGQAGPSWAGPKRLALLDAAEDLRDFARRDTQPDRLGFLRDAVYANGGQWTTHRTLGLFQATGIPVTKPQCRQLLAQLHDEGVVGRVERIGRRYYVPTERAA